MNAMTLNSTKKPYPAYELLPLRPPEEVRADILSPGRERRD